MYEQHAEEMQMLVANFRKRNNELRKERPACPSSLFHTWEALLQEVEIDSQTNHELTFQQVHLIGHGVGAHIAGYVGKSLKPHKITG
ncbi:hypothetical protein HUJ04_002197 [Dendroctonus ponderosae]|nr:hypothetical protein HUJ04_002197 [Dendroctonus ponderosae]